MRSVTRGSFHRSVLLTGTAAIAAIAIATPGAALAQEKSFDLPAQAASTGIPAFAQQAGIQLLTSGDVVRGKRTNAVRGTYEVDAALRMLLAGTGLEASPDTAGTGIITIRTVGAPGESYAGGGSGSDERAAQAGQRGISEILVVGSRTQNVDVRRTEDDPQPYVVFDADEIKKSNVTTLDDFLRTRLPMNTQNVGVNQRDTFGGFNGGNGGKLNLRGLGTNQTLVLVDGRRVSGVGDFDLQQSNISGIPLASIERIEVLPSTAGAIFGGSAVGGVVNIILKHDYRGLDLAVDYGNTFDGATGDLKLSLNGGFTVGKTRVSVRASHNKTGDLTYSSRNELFRRSFALRQMNNPAPDTTPPLGTTPNICGSTPIFFPGYGYFGSCDGTQLTLKAGGTPLGSSFTYVPAGYDGSDGGLALLANAGRYNIDMPEQPSTLIRGIRSTALGLNVRQTITDHVEAFVDMSWDRTPARYHENYLISGIVPADDPNNPFNEAVLVNYITPGIYSTQTNLVINKRINGGLIIRLPRQWSMSIEHTEGRSRSRSSSIYNPLLSADRLDALSYGLRDTNLFPPGPYTLRTSPNTIYGPNTSRLQDSFLRASGPVFDLPGGSAIVSTLLERRKEGTGYLIQFNSGEGSPDYFSVLPPGHQRVESAYLEARLPLFSSLNGRPWLRELELQASIRHDRYATTGVSGDSQFQGETLEEAIEAASGVAYGTNRIRSTDYLLALRYKPVDDLTLRASYSTGFLPPALTQVKPFPVTFPATWVPFYTDPQRGNTAFSGDSAGNFTQITGGSAELKPELSKSWSLGLIFTPQFLSGLRLSVDYTHIFKDSEITSVGVQYIVDNEDLYPGRVIRDPLTPADIALGYTAGPITSVDTTYINSFHSTIESIDYQLDYDFEPENLGNFHFYLVASQSINLKRQIDAALPEQQLRGYAEGALKWRLNLGLDWQKGPVRLGWNMQYYSSYNGNSPYYDNGFTLNQGTSTVPAQSYHDIFASYHFDNDGPLKDLEIAGGIQNLFNTRPPVINAHNGTYSTFGDPRLRRFTLSLRKHF